MHNQTSVEGSATPLVGSDITTPSLAVWALGEKRVVAPLANTKKALLFNMSSPSDLLEATRREFRKQ